MINTVYKKYKDILPYLFFGVCTTLVNVIVYWLLAHPANFKTMPSTVIAWLAAVLFAYLTNRQWVFHSNAVGLKPVLTEMFSFFLCRLATGIVDWACMLVFVDILGLHDVVIKFLANVLVIVLNYIASKRIIFKKDRN